MELIIMGAVILIASLIALIMIVKRVFRRINGKKVEPEPKQQSQVWIDMVKAASGNPEMEKALAKLMEQHLR